ncbi:uncharacterized protein LOC129616795 [Condylostylus longicornis]|uniref:uncharacterized protein LOC129616795 n=1 Tax=Condylostylus longicornis TaxID=2530218 RepID=UPI00244DF60E|nr:uncharacterized protein LOC129616795 [Condylostylus longicornis]
MISASHLFVGEHDFRNFCKLDADRVRHFRRKILWINFEQVSSSPSIWEIEIAGLSFLWHQIRCMMAVLFLIGRGLESQDVISKMLDVNRTPKKPVYELADDVGLILYDCFFEGLHFHKTPEQIHHLRSFKTFYLQHLQSAAVFRCMSMDSPLGNARQFSMYIHRCAFYRYVLQLARSTEVYSVTRTSDRVVSRRTEGKHREEAPHGQQSRRLAIVAVKSETEDLISELERDIRTFSSGHFLPEIFVDKIPDLLWEEVEAAQLAIQANRVVRDTTESGMSPTISSYEKTGRN